MICLPNDVSMVIDQLEEAGYEAWAVGGCVRDSLLGKTPKDYDVASSCPPADVCGLFPRCVNTGVAYGTVTVLTSSCPVEVTVFRCESDYSDNRHPASVSPALDIETDLSRRDFTINAMAWHPGRGLCDPFGGQADLECRQIRAVGDPFVRFGEDALRILRCLRFASQLNFDIDSHTREAALQLAPSLAHISVERIVNELRRLLTGTRPELAAALIDAGGLSHVGLHRLPRAELLRRLPPIISLRLAGLLWLSLTDQANTSGLSAQHTLRLLRMDKRTIYTVECLLNSMCRPLPTNAVELKRAFSALPPERWDNLLILRAVLLDEETRPVFDLLEQVAGQPWNRMMLAITGNDLCSIGIHGHQTGEILAALLDLVLQQPSLNTAERLLKLVQELVSAQNPGK